MNQSNKQLRVAVVGLGPVGCTLAAHLVDAGAFVVGCDIDQDRIEAIKRDGIRIENRAEKHIMVANVCNSVEALAGHDLDLVAIAVKTASLQKVASLISKSCDDTTSVMCAQNGLDNEKEVAAIVGEDRTLRMVVNYAGGMSKPSTVNLIFFSAPNYIAALSPSGHELARKVADLLTASGLTTETPDNIQHYVWEKTILNAALAPVCAISQLTMKEVTDDPESLALVAAILVESIGVAKAEGFEYRNDFHDSCLKYLKGGGHHRPSMAVDLQNGLPTEIGYLNGRIIEYGEKHQVPTPVNRTITALVHMLEKQPE